MADEFAEHLLVSSLAHMCRQQGWHQASRSGLSLFSDIARHYIRNIGILSLQYALHGGRLEPDLDDIGNAFHELGLQLSDLQSFWSGTEPNRGLQQVCCFPAIPPSLLDSTETPPNPDYVPDYLPSFVVKQESPVKDADKTIKEESTAGNETLTEVAVDPFDVAAAAPAPTAPNFPFINKSDIPVPVMSSWGFQRINIDTKPSKADHVPVKSQDKQPHVSPDNYHISENSDDFVFASKHSRAKEEKQREDKMKEESLKTLDNDLTNGLTNISKSSSENSSTLISTPNSKEINHKSAADDLNSSLFRPSLGASTPLVNSDKLSHVKNGQNGVLCKQQLFNHTPKSPLNDISIKKEDMSLDKTATDQKLNNLNDSDSEDFNDFGFGGSSSDEMTSKENVDRLLKPLSPLPSSPVNSLPPKSPPSKRRKLESPSSPNLSDSSKTLLKNRPDLIRNDVTEKPKPQCKLLNNHVSSKKKTEKSHKKDHISKKSEKKSDLLKKTLNNSHTNSVKNKPKKVRKKGVQKPIQLFNEIPMKMPSSHKSDIPKKSSEKNPVILNKISVPASTVSSIEPTKLKIAPITLSLPKMESDVFSKKSLSLPPPNLTPPSKPETPPLVSSKQEKVTPLKIPLKNAKNSKYKSKSTVDSEDDLSSLSSDSLDGFEELLPSKSKAKKTDVSSRTFKTKAELKNPWPSGTPPDPPSKSNSPIPQPPEPERKKQKSGITTKIKIGKSSSQVTQKPMMKLKLPLPPASSPSRQELNSSIYSQPSLCIEESILDTDEKPPIPSLKIPKIKIKLGGSSLKPQPLSVSQSQSSSSTQSSMISPEPIKTIKPLKIKLPDPSKLSIKSEPKSEKPAKSEVKKKVKKPRKPKAEVKSYSQPIKKVVKSEPAFDPEPISIDSSVTIDMESSVISETVISETVGVTSDPVKVWYCPACKSPDDGSPMVGCDKCDEWYHWPCVGLVQAPPDDSDWFCPPCSKQRKSGKGKKPAGKRKRKT